MPFRLQLADEEDGYRIVGPNGEEGELVDYGVPASLTIPDGELKGNYTALVGTPDQSEWEPPEGVVFRGEAMETVVERATVQYEVEGPEEEGEDEAEDDDQENGENGGDDGGTA